MAKNVGNRSAVARPEMQALDFTSDTTLADSTALDLSGYSLVAIRSTAGTANTHTLYADKDGTGTYTICNDSSGTQISVTISDTDWYVLPPESFAFTYVKFVAGSTDDTGMELVGKG